MFLTFLKPALFWGEDPSPIQSTGHLYCVFPYDLVTTETSLTLRSFWSLYSLTYDSSCPMLTGHALVFPQSAGCQCRASGEPEVCLTALPSLLLAVAPAFTILLYSSLDFVCHTQNFLYSHGPETRKNALLLFKWPYPLPCLMTSHILKHKGIFRAQPINQPGHSAWSTSPAQSIRMQTNPSSQILP